MQVRWQRWCDLVRWPLLQKLQMCLCEKRTETVCEKLVKCRFFSSRLKFTLCYIALGHRLFVFGDIISATRPLRKQ